jgi:outer membrane protein
MSSTRTLLRLVLALALVVLVAPREAQAQQGLTIRANGALVAPTFDSDSDNVLSESDGVEVGNGFSFAFSLSYGFTDNIAVTLLGAAPFSHSIEGTGDLDGLDIGSTLHLPPTLVVEYRFLPNGRVNPYVGAGGNVTLFFSEDTDDALTAALAANSTDLDLSPSVGLAAMAGVDVLLGTNWGINGQVWFADIDTDADVIVNGDTAVEDVTVQIDPLVFQAGLFYRF